jgi:hypothetical protein
MLNKVKQIKGFFCKILLYNVEMKKTYQLGVRMSEELALLVQRVSEMSGVTPSMLARIAMEEFCIRAEEEGLLRLRLSRIEMTSQIGHRGVANVGNISVSTSPPPRRRPRPKK